MKNIHILPTDKLSSLRIGDNGNFVFGLMQSAIVSKNDFYTNQNIYITNDEKGKKGDWVIEFQKGNSIGEVCFIGNEYVIANDIQKKIILTDNEDLIKDGVQPIDDEFLEWFVKNSSCEEVKVEKTFVTNSGLGYQEYVVLDSNFKVIEINAKIPQTSYYLGKVTILNTYEYVINYKIIIPKEEPKYPIGGYAPGYYGCTCVTCKTEFMGDKRAVQCEPCAIKMTKEEPKQETLEEAAERLSKDAYKKHSVKDDKLSLDEQIQRSGGFIVGFKEGMSEGAKWQEGRMYSEEEANTIWKAGQEYWRTSGASITFEELTEQLKKK